MRPRFQADADLRYEIVHGVLRREPTVDFQSAQGSLRDGMPDPEVLAFAAAEDRILVSHDVRTMPATFHRYVEAGHESPGVMLIRQSHPTAVAIEEILLFWAASDAAEWRNSLIWIPY